jgi:lactoylglutathione lyase
MVEDLNESLKFYHEIVGLKINRRFNAGPGVEIAFLGDGESKTELELICNDKVKEINVGEDISWGFTVESVDKMIELLKENGIGILSGPFQPNPSVKFFYVSDPNGFKIQFVEEH